MGLSGRKVKQRIPQDPRNLTWADDAARFGSNYLSKFGWDASKGLGAGGDGRTTHIKVSHKLDMLGIGAGHQKDPNGIAWKQNRDFENLLRRLNENLSTEQTNGSETKAEEDGEKDEEKAVEVADEPETEMKKKRKHKDDGEDEKEEKKKRKREKKAKASDEMDVEQTETVVSVKVDAVVEQTVATPEVKRPVVPRHRAHRARAIAAKNISSKSAVHISEILGVAPTDSVTASSSLHDPHQGKLTSLTDDNTDGLEVEKITTSTKSVADYFKEKLLARTGIKQEDSSTPSSSNSSAEDDADGYDRPRMGLGASRMRTEIHAEVKIEEATQRMGLSKFSSLMSSSFLASTSIIPPTFVKTEEAEEGIAHLSEAESEPVKKEKKDKKDKKKKKKEEVKEEEAESEVPGEVEKKDKKKKKDKKGKNKASESDLDEEKSEKKEKSKKDKSSKGETPANSSPEDANEADAAPSSSKNEKRKRKSESDQTLELDSKKARKEKKKHRTPTEAED
ncbi:hypothetical protein CPC08DRAFT_660002 [Agrocybe pediades]|nr:hypothetical protein CPC08DRAFT_660002 [Agrocybe pediades]